MSTPTSYAHFLIVADGATVVARWQQSWRWRTVEFGGHQWEWLPFSARGIVSGDVSSEASLEIRLPVTGRTGPIFRNALHLGWWTTFQGWEFDGGSIDNGPPPDGRMVTDYQGEIVNLSRGAGSMTVEIGSPLAPIGVQFPPRSMTATLIGVPCQLAP